LGESVRPQGVDSHESWQLGGISVDDGLPPARHPGVVDQNVDRAEVGGDGRHQPVQRVEVADGGRVGSGGSARGRDVLDHLGGGGGQLDGQDAFGDEVGGVGPDDVHAHDGVAVPVDDELGEPVAGAHGGGPAEGGDRDGDGFGGQAGLAGAVFGVAGAGHFRVG